MAYAEQDSIEAGLSFKTPSGLTVRTTGSTTLIESNGIYCHEVEIVEGPGQGSKFLLNMDKATPL
jgi:hypothetical protein